jgi:hypothetical protein
LARIRVGDEQAAAQLVPLVYKESQNRRRHDAGVSGPTTRSSQPPSSTKPSFD